jgi:2-hydroxy-3-keto-5-methylthiopentenyl-1-phosphate phosphatase
MTKKQHLKIYNKVAGRNLTKIDMSRNAKQVLEKLMQDCDSVCDLASDKAKIVIEKIKTLKGRRLDKLAQNLERLVVDSVIDLETQLLTNRKFAREALES